MGAGVTILVGTLRLYRRYRKDMENVRASMAAAPSSSWRAETFLTGSGLTVQYMVRDHDNGTTVPKKNKTKWCLVLHPAGGGCDQGMLLGEWLLPKEDWGIVAPSRAGYLKSEFNTRKKDGESTTIQHDSTSVQFDDAFVEVQAKAIIELLDHLGLPQVSILGLSAGGILSVELARRYPLRISGLVLVSPLIPYNPNSTTTEEENIPNPPKWVLKLAFGNDAVKWMAVRLFPDATIQSMFGSTMSTSKLTSSIENKLMEADGSKEGNKKNQLQGVVAREDVLAFLETFLPARERFPGFLLDFEAMRTHRLTADQLMEVQCKILFLASKSDVQSKLEYNRFPPSEMMKKKKTRTSSSTNDKKKNNSSDEQITEIIRESGTHMLLNDIPGTKMAIEQFLQDLY